jgi:hypothetical protein
LVTAKSGTSITLRFTTFIAAAPTGPYHFRGSKQLQPHSGGLS